MNWRVRPYCSIGCLDIRSVVCCHQINLFYRCKLETLFDGPADNSLARFTRSEWLPCLEDHDLSQIHHLLPNRSHHPLQNLLGLTTN